MPKECLPPHLQNAKHDDWIWPFSYVPRAWTSYCGSDPGYKPIPEPGQQVSHLWPPYYAITTENRWHFRIGARWDDVDHYYQFPSLVVKRV